MQSFILIKCTKYLSSYRHLYERRVRVKRWFDVALLLISLVAYAVPVAAQSANLTGEWEVHLKSPRGSYTFKAALKQDGERLSGQVIGILRQRSAPLHGTIKGKELKAVCQADIDGNLIKFTLTGEVDGDSIKGKADFSGFSQGDWSAKRIAGVIPPAKNKETVNNLPSGESINVSGTWRFRVETESGSSYPTLTLKQEGERLAGHYNGAFIEATLNGTVKHNEIRFSFKVQAQAGEVTFTYTGTVEKNSMEGIIKSGEQNSGTWIATRH